METNLLKSLGEYITPDLISQASSMLGESNSGITKAFSGAMPTLLSGLLNNVDKSDVMDGIMGLANDKGFDASSVLTSLPSLLSGSGNTSALNAGSSMLSMLFGNKQSGVFDLIGNFAGIKSSSTLKLMGMAAPMVLGFIRKSGMNKSSLIKMLSSQKDDISKALPTGFDSLMGYGSKIKEEVKKPLKQLDPLPEKSKNKWMWPLLLLLAALALFYFLRQCQGEKVIDPVVPAVDTIAVKKVVEEMPKVNADWARLGDLIKVNLPNGIVLSAPEMGIENNLAKWLADNSKVVDKDTWFNFDRLLFATAQANLLPESQEQLKNMAEVLKAYPNVELKIGGYTDNVGDPNSNMSLSDARAKSVMNELVAMGIDASRLTAEGYGEQHPVASNDTEEGRAQNRRIAVRVTKK
jgi:outer membrane protein OmpA-like peptidoglycan-associated protein